MARIKREGYTFKTWKSDHPPRHVHVFHKNRLVLKYNLDYSVAMSGKPTRRILDLIRELQAEGRL